MKTIEAILITGAGRGIGLSTTLELLNSGQTVVAVSRNLTALEPLAVQFPKQLIIQALNLESPEAPPHLVAELGRKGIRLKGLINNAGALVNKPFHELSPEDFQVCYEVNVFGPARMIQACIPIFTKEAHVVNISSIGGFQGSLKFAGLSAYSSSKAAMVGLTECLQEEFKDTGWAFNCLCLGSVHTEMLAAAFPGYQGSMTPEAMGQYISHFVLHGHKTMRGKILPVSITNP
jgi:3-oxoacyl-[acyl-carrier protein] reductase